MRHTFACAMRWADMDLLGHVNNVRYLEYVAQARDELLGPVAARATVRSHQVQFVAPLVFRRGPVLVDSWVTGYADGAVHLAHEVHGERDGERVVHLQVSSVVEDVLDDADRTRLSAYDGDDHDWRPVPRELRAPRSAYDVAVRVGDLGRDGHVRDVVLFEYLQEARIRYLMDLHTRGQAWSHHVVARTDLQLHRPLRADGDHRIDSWIGHLGNRSFTIDAEVRDGDELVAEAQVVMVTFDKETQRPAPMADSQRQRLEAEVAG